MKISTNNRPILPQIAHLADIARSFLYSCIYRKIGPPPGSHVFQDIVVILAFLVKGHLNTVSTKYYSNLASGFGEEYFQRFLYSIRKSGPAPWWPYFSRHHHDLSNLGRRSPKDYFYQIAFKSRQWFWRRIF